MKIVILGGTGLIGSKVVNLLRSGATKSLRHLLRRASIRLPEKV